MEANANDIQQATHKERKKKDGKCLFLIHQCVDSNVFEKIIEEETTKGTWDKLKSMHDISNICMILECGINFY